MVGSGRCSVFSCYLPRVLASYSADQIIPELPVVFILSQGAEICCFSIVMSHIDNDQVVWSGRGHLRSDY